MPACSRCGGRICKGETACFNCQMPLEDVKSKKDVNLARFRLVVDVLFYICLALTIASLMFNIGFRTAITGAATLIFRLVKLSAGEMSEKNS
jgi:hypothetical protein